MGGISIELSCIRYNRKKSFNRTPYRPVNACTYPGTVLVESCCRKQKCKLLFYKRSVLFLGLGKDEVLAWPFTFLLLPLYKTPKYAKQLCNEQSELNCLYLIEGVKLTNQKTIFSPVIKMLLISTHEHFSPCAEEGEWESCVVKLSFVSGV